MYVLPNTMIKAFLLAIEGSTTLFPSGFLLKLYTNNITPSGTNVVGDFTQLTNVEVPGYVAGAPTWNATPQRNQDNSWSDSMSDILFAATSTPPSPQVVYGWLLTDSGGTTLLGAGLLDVPFTFQDNGDGFQLEGSINCNQTSDDQVTTTLEMIQS